MYSDGWAAIHQGNALDVLAQMPMESVDLVCTSPPYWGLRKYSGSQDLVWDAAEGCEHVWGEEQILVASGGTASKKVHTHGTDNFQKFTASQGQFCQRCHAWRGAYGLEPTPDCGNAASKESVLREDLTLAERHYVLSELERLGLL